MNNNLQSIIKNLEKGDKSEFVILILAPLLQR